MAIADLDAYLAKAAAPSLVLPVQKTTISATVAGYLVDTWVVGAVSGAAPTTAVAPTSATTGALGDFRGTDLRIVSATLSALTQGTYILCDRLSHQGGLSGTATGAQTTNLPTAALTRYTSGAGVMCGITIYTQIGTTPTTFTVSYTNQGGSGATSVGQVIGGTNFREAQRMILVPPASGDTGFRAVASLTAAASTTTAGNYGITLFKPLAAFTITEPAVPKQFGFFDGMIGGLQETIASDACLFFLRTCPVATTLEGSLSLAEV